MSINKKIIVAAFASLALGASSCKRYLDVNNNPNISQQVTVATLLPAAELYTGSAMGVDMQVYGSIWSQYWTQSPDGKEYIPFETMTPGQEAFNMAWGNLYAGASNYAQLEKLSIAQNKKQYQAIAMLMQAYTFQVLTDAWGDVPYTEALNGQYPDKHVVNPKYDSQRVVYKGIIAKIDSAKKLINYADGNHPGSDDIIYGGDMRKWMKFANTLELRILMRLTDIDPIYADLALDTLYMTAPQFIGVGDEAKIAYGFNTANNNPLFSELSSAKLGGVQQLAGSKTAIDSMVANNDYRAMVFYNDLAGTGLVGVEQSGYDVPLATGSFSTPNAHTGADSKNSASGKASVMLLSSWESYFLQAEVAAKGLIAGNDAGLFTAGINASFQYWNNELMTETGDDAASAFTKYMNGDVSTSTPPARWAQYPAGGTPAQKTRFILTQKWFAMCGTQGFEAWTEFRRTGYPDFLVHARNSHINPDFPRRFLYPQSEKSTNASYPGLTAVNVPVWWDLY